MAPWPLIGALLRARRVDRLASHGESSSGSLYYVAAFFAIATQAVWSAAHLTLERLDTAVAIYAAFGLVSLGVRSSPAGRSRPLQPAWGGGVVLLLGLSLLFFLSLGRSRRRRCGRWRCSSRSSTPRSSSRAPPAACRPCPRWAASCRGS